MAELIRELSISQPPPPHKLTFEEFLAWANEDTWAEWVDGEVVMNSPVAVEHEDIVGFLYTLARLFVEHHDLGRVLVAPFLIKLGDRGREPDLMFVATANLGRLRKTYLDGPADLVVEVLSPESAARDRGDKYLEYEAGGVPEYWMLNPIRPWAEMYQLGEDGYYHQVFAGREGVYHAAAIPGFWLRVEWLWQQPLPHVLNILKELGLVS